MVLATGKFLLLLDAQLNPLKEVAIGDSEEALAADVSWAADGKLLAVCFDTGKGCKCVQRDAELEIVRGPAKADPDGGVVQSVSEKGVEGLQTKVALMPSGSFGVGVEVRAGQNKGVIWEKNGLRHGEFPLPKGKVAELGWMLDGSVLLVALTVEGKTLVSFYQRMNYKWYNKNTIAVPGEICGFKWLTKKGRLLIVRADGKAFVCELEATVTGSVSRTTEEANFAGVAVADSNAVYVTHFDKTVIPPPMFNHQLSLPNEATVLKACYSASYFACLTHSSIVLFPVSDYQKPIVLTDKELAETLVDFTATQFLLLECVGELYVIVAVPDKDAKQDQVFIMKIVNDKIDKVVRLITKKIITVCPNAKYTASKREDLAGVNMGYFSLIPSQVPSDEEYILVQYEDKSIYYLPFAAETPELLYLDTSPQLFQQMAAVRVSGKESVIGLTEGRRLYANSVLFSTDVTSFLVSDDLLFLTRSTSGTSHLLYVYDLLSSLPVPSVQLLVMI